ncbi:MAG: HAMP domain-containing protein [Acidobacteriota bacterium]|nr:MAG: HAMP domain-containing protein [Acidobacteriota bacterium]
MSAEESVRKEDLEERRRRQRLAYRIATLGIALLLAVALVFGGLVRSHPEWFEALSSEGILLYAVTSLNIILIAALLFILFRNLVKLAVERKRGILGAHFRTKLLWAFLLIAMVPSIGLFWVARDLIGKNIESLFNPPMESVLSNAFHIAESYYEQAKHMAVAESERLSAELAGPLARGDRSALRKALRREQSFPGVRRAAVYKPSGDVSASWLAEGESDVLLLSKDIEKLRRGERVVRWSEPDRNRLLVLTPIRRGGALRGVLAFETAMAGNLSRKAVLLGEQYKAYKQLSLRKRTIKHSRVWTYGTIYLLIIFSACWLGLYLARVITKPIEALLEGTHAVSTGRFDYRVEVEAADELGLLVQSFNEMTREVASSREALERSKESLEQANVELEARRRNIAAILENIPTGVISISADRSILSANGAAREILDLNPSEPIEGMAAEFLFRRLGVKEIWHALEDFIKNPAQPFQRHLALVLPARTVRVILSAVASQTLQRGDRSAGAILVLEDVTELSRAQKMAAWQEVAQRMAHEVKNPLTPIHLSAQRILKNYRPNDADYERLVRECVACIVEEVNALKALVDEFSRFARLPAPQPVDMNLEECIDSALVLYEGHHENLSFEKRVPKNLPLVKGDPEQFKRALVNLLENAVEATNRRGAITVTASFDEEHHIVRVEVRDTGRGVSPEEREKLFLPYFSTKAKGMGLGLAIVSRIVSDHSGRITVSENVPQGSVFTVEIPA